MLVPVMKRIALLLIPAFLTACSGGLETTASTQGTDNSNAADAGVASDEGQGDNGTPSPSRDSTAIVGQYTLSQVSRTSRTGEQIDSSVENSDLQGRVDFGADGAFTLSIALPSEPWVLNLKGRYSESETDLLQISASNCSGPVDATIQLADVNGKKTLTMIFPEGFCDNDYGLTSTWISLDS